VSTTTRVIAVDSEEPAPWALEVAAEVLQHGGLVAFATETVYGLGADATNPEAVARIFAAKGRPAFNPLIVHASGTAMARTCVRDWPDAADALATAFWPGPLTLVVPRSERIPDIVTAGGATVGLRVPRPAIARRLITTAGRPIAAPSANRSTRTSPTRAEHVVEDLGGRIDLILDSGPTAVGLESTVLDLTPRHPRVLRPGPITAGEIAHVLGVNVVETTDEPQPAGPLSSPGQMDVHYAPRTCAVRVDAPGDLGGLRWPPRAALLVIGPHTIASLSSSLHQFRLETPEAAARDLYAVLHECDRLQLDLVVVLPPPDRPEWAAVRDRIRRATQPYSNNLRCGSNSGTSASGGGSASPRCR
jgi:L-threonylcarbamoyladenylate synthase